MKKNLVALAVAALAVSSFASANAATIYDKDGTSLAAYGRVQSVYYSNHATGVSNNNDSINTSGRLGLNMRSQITNDIAAVGKLEWEVANGDSADGQNNFSARYLWAGLDFGAGGQLTVGRMEPAMKYAISLTDCFDDWGCAGLAGNDDKRDGTIKYAWNGYGFDVIASVSLAEDGEHIDGAYALGEKADVEYTASFALGYTSPDVVFGPIAVRAGYETAQFADGKVDGFYQNASRYYDSKTSSWVNDGERFDSYDQFAIQAAWGSLDVGPYIAATYQQRKFDLVALPGATDAISEAKLSGYEVVVGYAFGNGVSVRTGYLAQNYEVGSEDVDAAVVPVYVNWQLNPQFNVWAEARFDAGTDADDNGGKNFFDVTGVNYEEDVFSVGMRYSF